MPTASSASSSSALAAGQLTATGSRRVALLRPPSATASTVTSPTGAALGAPACAFDLRLRDVDRGDFGPPAGARDPGEVVAAPADARPLARDVAENREFFRQERPAGFFHDLAPVPMAITHGRVAGRGGVPALAVGFVLVVHGERLGERSKLLG